MDTPKPTQAPPPTAGERIWRNVFFLLSAALAGLALVQFEAGRLARGLGDLGAAVLRASADDDATPEKARRRSEELMRQAAELKAAHPWSDMAGRAGWVLLGISLVLRFTGAA